MQGVYVMCGNCKILRACGFELELRVSVESDQPAPEKVAYLTRREEFKYS